jgi:hypothetical protein
LIIFRPRQKKKRKAGRNISYRAYSTPLGQGALLGVHMRRYVLKEIYNGLRR